MTRGRGILGTKETYYYREKGQGKLLTEQKQDWRAKTDLTNNFVQLRRRKKQEGSKRDDRKEHKVRIWKVGKRNRKKL